jgi:hypothetical protein
MTYVGGSFTHQNIRDTRGTSDNFVAGNNNNVTYAGDNGANTFRVGGYRNNVTIRNIGRDENIQLEGRAQDWVQLQDANARDGSVSFYNKVTGNTVNLQTDGGRNDSFVQSKVNFTGNYQSLGNLQNPCNNAIANFSGWNNLGVMAHNPSSFDGNSYLAGYMAGRNSGVRDGFAAGAGWGVLNMLMPRAWSCF